MGSRLTLAAPADFVLARDVCSYGYFLLRPNLWDVREQTLSRVLDLADGPVFVRIGQNGGDRARTGAALTVACSRALSRAERRELTAKVTRMLRLDESAELIAAFHGADPRFAASGRGRLFRSPSLFEDVIKTVTSCNVTWPSTVVMNERMCAVLGSKVTVEVGEGVRRRAVVHRGFPLARVLARTRPATLRSRCRVGYRDGRIVALAKIFAAKGGREVAWIEDGSLDDGALFKRLVELPGIGPYAAANIMQTLGRYGRIPLDTESVRHGKALLGMKGTPAAIMKRMKAHYEPFGIHAFRSYWFELWDDYERRHGKAWTWERDSTGKLFTAALLNKPAERAAGESKGRH